MYWIQLGVWIMMGAFALSADCFAQSLPKLLPSQTIRDEFSLQRSISGQDDIAGIFLGPGDQGADLGQLGTFLPPHTEPQLCAAFATRNGQYKGKFGYDVRSAPAGKYLVEFRSKYQENLKGQKAEQLAVTFWLASSCGGQPTVETGRLPAFWHPGTDRTTVEILVNSGRLTARIYDGEAKEKSKRVSACQRLDPPATAFDQVCPFAWPGSGSRLLELQLFQFEDMQDHPKFVVSMP